MCDERVAEHLRSLRTVLESGGVSAEDVGRAFERLTFLLTPVTRDEDGELRALVNEIELIRFTRLPADIPGEIEKVLARAQPLFDSVEGRCGGG